MEIEFLDGLLWAMLGGNSIGHQSLVDSVCEDFEHPPLTWNEALDLLRENDYDVEECPCCGWVVEGSYHNHSEHEEGVCDSCAEEEE